MREPLSVTVVTYNEARNLARCLESVAWAEERLVVDSGSHDATQEIARRCGARVLVQPWLGYAAQKNRALEAARHRWVLSLDADEWLDAEAARAIQEELAAARADGYRLRRRTAFCGAFVRFSWGRDEQLRLFRRDRGRFEGGSVHERVRLYPGSCVRSLPGTILHLSYRSLGDYVRRMDHYSALAAGDLRARGRRSGAAQLVLLPLAAFLKCYLWRGGFLDGLRGWLIAWGSAYTVLLKHGKLWEQQRGVAESFRRLVPPTAEDPEPGAPPPLGGPHPSG